MADLDTGLPLTVDSIYTTHRLISPYIHHTPVLTSKTLDRIASTPQDKSALKDTHFEEQQPAKSIFWLYFKCENFQKIGAPVSFTRLIVERISEEHSIVSWEGKQADSSSIPLSVEEVVKVYPNHACVTASFYNFYFVVDSDQDPEAAQIVDVWVRLKGSDITNAVLLPRVQ